MKLKTLIAGITTAFALTAGLSSPAFAEYVNRYQAPEKVSKAEAMKHAEPGKKSPAEHPRAINTDEVHLLYTP